MRLDSKVTTALNCSKTYAQTLIKDEKVKVNGKTITKNGFMTTENDQVEIQDNNHYVSRSAYKLKDAITSFNVSFKDKIVVDVGASTGGFSQVLLEENAKQVYCLDVGSNQLHPSIKNHPNVKNYENINCRYIEPSMFDTLFDAVVMDVSFISIELIIPAVLSCCNQNVELVILVKPQFEIGKQYINKHGIVKDQKQVNLMLKAKENFFNQLNLKVIASKPSETKGKDGNQEYLFYLKRE